MPIELDVQNELLAYTAQFGRPAFELWGRGGPIVKGLYEALHPAGVTLASIQVNGFTPTAADPIITIRIGQNGIGKFTWEKLELSFSNFSEPFFRTIPSLLQASTDWIRSAIPSFPFAAHQFAYSSHSVLKTSSNVVDFLSGVNPKTLKSAGSSLGNGVVFNSLVPEKKWVTQLVLDRSLVINGGLYLALSIAIKADVVDYETVMVEGRTYLAGILQEIGLTFPEIS